jgi:hypothetical protein
MTRSKVAGAANLAASAYRAGNFADAAALVASAEPKHVCRDVAAGVNQDGCDPDHAGIRTSLRYFAA